MTSNISHNALKRPISMARKFPPLYWIEASEIGCYEVQILSGCGDLILKAVLPNLNILALLHSIFPPGPYTIRLYKNGLLNNKQIYL